MSKLERFGDQANSQILFLFFLLIVLTNSSIAFPKEIFLIFLTVKQIRQLSYFYKKTKKVLELYNLSYIMRLCNSCKRNF